MDPKLRELLTPYLGPVVPTPQETYKQAVNFKARSLTYIAFTFLDWDGPLDPEEIKEELTAGRCQWCPERGDMCMFSPPSHEVFTVLACAAHRAAPPQL